MDPHSRLSQFNQRPPKAGPDVRTPYQPPRPQQERPMKSKSPVFPFERRIATNSRIKQDEKYRNDIHLAYVSNALQQKLNGVNETFDELVRQFKPPDKSADITNYSQIRLWLLALSHVVSRLERQHALLVEAIVHMPWSTMDNATVKTYIIFIGMLLSARPEYLTLVLNEIAQGFTSMSGSKAINTGYPEGSSNPITRRTVYDRQHALLSHILSLVPTCPSTLFPLLARHFPHKRQDQDAHTVYIRNILRVSAYCHAISSKILATIVDRALQIDVEIQVEIEELEELETDQNDVFELDPFDKLVGDDEEDSETDEDEGDNFSDISSDPGDGVEDNDTPERRATTEHIREMVRKLDQILTLIFKYLRDGTPDIPPQVPDPPLITPISEDTVFFQLSSPTTPKLSGPSTPMLLPAAPVSDKDARRAQFNTLLAIFERTILRTFKSRYTQFLLFYYSSLDPEYADIFQGVLGSKALLEENQPVVTRAAAASYIGSFVSRANFVGKDETRNAVAFLCEFLKSHLDAYNAGNGRGVSAGQDTIFYAVTQAVFLIFCFRWRDLLEEDDEYNSDEFYSHTRAGKKWVGGLDVMKRLISSGLNPLKACSPAVVMQFARVAHATDFLYCYTVLESNRRSDNGPTSTMHFATVNGVEHLSELNTFFPFDPYQLPQSSVYIKDIFREWSSVAIDEEDGDEEDEEGEEEPMANSVASFAQRLAIPTNRPKDQGAELSTSLSAMSISM